MRFSVLVALCVALLCLGSLASVASADNKCAVCEFVVTEAASLLEGDVSVHEAQSLLNKVCDALPGQLGAQCHVLVNTYGAKLVQWIKNHDDPVAVCARVNVCKSAAVVVEEELVVVRTVVAPVMNRVVKVEEKTPTSAGGLECTLCEAIFKEVEVLLQSNYSEANIEKVLESVCSTLPKSLTSLCDSIIEQYTPTLIQMLVARASPQQICKAIGMCSATKMVSATPLKKQQKQRVGGIECSLCTAVMTEVENLLQSNYSEANIEKVLGSVCNTLPKTLQGFCTELINQYTPVLIHLLMQRETPDAICKAIGMCKTATSSLAKTRMSALRNTKKQQRVGGLECSLCTAVMTEVENLLQSNYSEANIEKVLDSVCNTLPKTLQGFCTELINQYTPVLIHLLVQRETPDAICKAIGMCKTARLQRRTAVRSSALECSLCQMIMGEVEKLIGSDRSIQNIEKALDQVCNLLPGALRGTCDALVNNYTPVLIHLFEQKATPQEICQVIGLCAKTEQTVKGSLECSLCDVVIGEVEHLLQGNYSESHVEQVLEKVCSVLPSVIRGPCDQLIEAYTPQLITLLVSRYPADKICQAIGLCAAKKQQEQPTIVSLVEVGESPLRDAKCSLCELVMGEVEKLVGTNNTEAHVEEVLDKVCDTLPKWLQGSCSTLVNQYYPVLVQLLVQRYPANVICQKIKLCPPSTVPQEAPKTKVGNTECTICTFVVKLVDTIVAENRTEAAIEKALDEVCAFLPGELKALCDSFVAQYTDAIIQAVLARETPQALCSQLKLCTSAKLSVAPVQAVGDLRCTACEYIAGLIEQFVASNHTESEIVDFIMNVCNLLPSSLRSECDGIIQEYLPVIIDYVLNKEDPQQLCTQIKLCSKSAAPKHVAVAARKSVTGMECAACEYIAALLEQFVSTNRTETEIIAFMDKICTLLPSTLKSTCDSIIEAYGPVIIDYILNKENPQTLCTQIKLCTRQNATFSKVHKVGGFQCATCEYVIGLAEQMLENDADEQEIAKFLENVCKFFPSNFVSSCDAFIEEFGPILFKWLATKAGPPAQFCASVGLCQKSKIVKQEKPLKGIACSVCQYAVAYLENAISNQTSEAEIEKLVGNLCNVLPSAVRGACTNFVDTYAPALIQWFVNREPPQQFCSSVHLC